MLDWAAMFWSRLSLPALAREREAEIVEDLARNSRRYTATRCALAPQEDEGSLA